MAAGPTGTLPHLAGARALSSSGDDIIKTQSDLAGTGTVPPTINQTTTTTAASTVPVTPRTRCVAVVLQSLGGDAADPCAGDTRVLGASLLYVRPP